jgi:hypothetical protein
MFPLAGEADGFDTFLELARIPDEKAIKALLLFGGRCVPLEVCQLGLIVLILKITYI